MSEPSELAKTLAARANRYFNYRFGHATEPLSQHLADAGLADLEARLETAERERHDARQKVWGAVIMLERRGVSREKINSVLCLTTEGAGEGEGDG